MKRLLRDQTGVAVIIVAILIAVFIGFVALAVDIGHLFVVDNQLKNAADAGALAGARVLYINSGTAVNPLANQDAYDVALKNKSEKIAVDVHWSSGQNDGSDIERGHWSFGLGTLKRGFYHNPSLAPVSLPDNNTVELDQMKEFINAVRVRARREDTPAASFFATIFGHSSFIRSAEAVAYLGYAGNLLPGEVDWPIAICRQAITVDDKLRCGVGRMINSSTGEDHETGGWTNFTQDNPEIGTSCEQASTPTVRPLATCGGDVNPASILFGMPIGTIGGMVDDIFKDMIKCWKANANIPDPDWKCDVMPDKPWTITLPVILCPGSNVKSCDTDWPVDGAVEVNVVWITRTGTGYDCVPKKMSIGEHNWTCSTPSNNEACWGEFVKEFNLKIVLGGKEYDAQYEHQTIYFLPSCKDVPIRGTSGGHNYGILAEIPVLVN